MDGQAPVSVHRECSQEMQLEGWEPTPATNDNKQRTLVTNAGAALPS